MERGMIIKSNGDDINNSISSTNLTYYQILESLKLPTENVVSTIEERKTAISLLPNIMDNFKETDTSKANYLSKFVIALGSGLFDAALNYLWDETISQLRIRISNGYLDYFYDSVIDDENRKNFKTSEDLVKITDFKLLEGAYDIGLITEVALKKLDYIRYMRNNNSAAHPNVNQISGIELMSFMENCIKLVILLPISNNLLQVSQFLKNIKENEITEDDALMISTVIKNLDPTRLDNLSKAFFSIYLDSNTSQTTRNNINLLAPEIWSLTSEEVKNECGNRYAILVANNNPNKEQAYNYLKLVNGLVYISDSIKIPNIKIALRDLRTAHDGMNNFYNEPFYVRRLIEFIGKDSVIPEALNYEYVKSIVYVFLTNGYGESWEANDMYIDLIKKFDIKQSFIAMISFWYEKIKLKLQYSRCQNKFNELLDLIKTNILTAGCEDLFNEIKSNVENLKDFNESNQMVSKIKYYKASILN